MKRIREESTIDLTSDSVPKETHTNASAHILACGICRRSLSDHCGECESLQIYSPTHEPAQCQGTVNNAICGHTFHSECISRWLDNRPYCPLCNEKWLFPWGLNLQQLAAAKLVHNERAIVALSLLSLPENVIDIFDGFVSAEPTTNHIQPGAQRLLAITFARYLTRDEKQCLPNLRVATHQPDNNPPRL